MNKRRLGWRFNLHDVQISNNDLRIPNLPESFHGYRIVQISDFHLGTWLSKDHLEQIVRRVNALDADLVVITGDFVNHNAEKFTPDLADVLVNLKPKSCKFAVLGNHDHWTDADAVRWSLSKSDIIELRNDIIAIQKNGSSINLAGIDDHLAGFDNLGRILDKLPDESVTILLAHEPDFAEISAPTRKFSLQLSGHSHGGQINLPLIGAPYLPPLGRLYPQGLYQINGMQLYTNRGLGTSWLGLRFNCPAEISIFNLFAC
jgi:predicted MPP superfamily phosphohydrolase